MQPPLSHGQPQTLPHHLYPPAPDVPRRRRRSAMLVAVVAVVLMAGGAGAAIGAIAGTGPKGPTETPAIDAHFPHASQRYMRGVTVSSVAEDWLAQKEWTCEVRSRFNSRSPRRAECSPRGDTASDLEVTITYDSEKRVREVDLMCAYGPGNPTCRDLFTELAGTLLARDEKLRKQAVQWTGENVDNDASTVIGAVRLVATLAPHTLDCTPAS
jgi:hypothetical protein